MIKLRSDQEELVSNAYEALRTESRVQVVAACGSGKTISACRLHDKLIRETKGSLTIVLLPSLLLINQSIKEWKVASLNDFNYIVTCSDKQVDSINMSLSVSTEIDELKHGWNKRDVSKPTVLFSTINSYPVLVNFLKTLNLSVDYAIIDEAHRTTGKAYNNSTLINLNSYFPILKRIYFTATPRVIQSNLDSFISMDDKEYFGEVCYHLPFSKAIELNLLTKYKVLLVGVEGKEGEELKGSNLLEAYEKVAKKYNLKKTICFHKSVMHSKEFTSNSKEFSYYHVDGEMRNNLRSELMSSFKNNPNHAVLNNARCLTEGVDIPSVDSIMFCSPKNSTVDIIQAIGRAVRKSQNKETGYIILPILKTIDGEIGGYASILNILESLSTHDEILYSKLVSSNSQSTGSTTKKTIEDLIECDGIKFELSKLKIEELKIRLSKRVTKSDFIQLLERMNYRQKRKWIRDKNAWPKHSQLNGKNYEEEILSTFFPKVMRNGDSINSFSKKDYINLLSSKKYKSISEWQNDKDARPTRSSLHNKKYKYEIIEMFFGNVIRKVSRDFFIEELKKRNFKNYTEWRSDKSFKPSARSLKGKKYEKEIISMFFPNKKKVINAMNEQDCRKFLSSKNYKNIKEWKNDPSPAYSYESFRKRSFKSTLENEFFSGDKKAA